MPNDRSAIAAALNRLSDRDRANLLKEALEPALEALPESEAAQIRAMADTLAATVNKMGRLVALEVLAAVGMLSSEKGE